MKGNPPSLIFSISRGQRPVSGLSLFTLDAELSQWGTLSERTFLIRVKEDTYITLLELQKQLRFHDSQDKRRKTMDYVLRYLIRAEAELKGRR